MSLETQVTIMYKIKSDSVLLAVIVKIKNQQLASKLTQVLVAGLVTPVLSPNTS